MLRDFLMDDSMQNQVIKQIYHFIFENGPISRADIIKHTNLNRGKVTRSLKDLLDKRFIRIVGHGESEGGRPPSLYQVNPTSGYIIGIRISRMHTEIALFDALFEKQEEERITMTSTHTPEVVINSMITTIHRFMDKQNVTIDMILGIGMGAIGPLDREKGVILHPERFLAPGWKDIPIVEKVKEAFPVPVLLENGANVGALGEYKYNKAMENVLNVTVGWAWGCGVILDGELMNVKSGDVSGYGHMTVKVDGKECSCGKKGCAAAYTSLYSLLEEIKKEAPDFYHANLTNYETFPIDKLLYILNQGNPVVEKIIKDSALYLGAGLANLVTAFHADLIVLNGPLIHDYPGFYEATSSNISRHVTEPNDIKIKKGNREEDAGVIGAAHLLFDNLINHRDQR